MLSFEDYLRMLKKVCAACRKPVVGRSMSALNRVWHPEHFVCAHCHEPFGESNFWEKVNQPYCEVGTNLHTTSKKERDVLIF